MIIQIRKGSALILTLVAVLILSFMASGLLTVGNTETLTTENYQLTKEAYYVAVQGVEEIRNEIYNKPEEEYVKTITKSSYETEQYDTHGGRSYYFTGPQYKVGEGGSYVMGDPLEGFPGFIAPQFAGMDLGKNKAIKMAPMIWKVHVTSEVSTGSKNRKMAYSELIVGVYAVIKTN